MQSVTKLSSLSGASDTLCASGLRAWDFGYSYTHVLDTFAGQITNLHLLAIPLFVNKIAKALFGALKRLLDAISVKWRNKLLIIINTVQLELSTGTMAIARMTNPLGRSSARFVVATLEGEESPEYPFAVNPSC
ncbi:hypothetical protein PC122_g14494 [Phytophthora cactorum]|nr:hypothetical protein PC122_g14494 [Phytophthora cactorum]